MPLKLKRRKGTRIWHVSGTVAGQRVRESTGTAERRLAEEWATDRERQIFRGAIYGPQAVVTWAQAVASYTEQSNPGGFAARRLLAITEHFGAGKLLRDIDQAAVTKAAKALCAADAAPATILRHLVTPVRAVLNHAADLKWCEPPRLKALRDPDGGRIDKARTRWLRPEEYHRLHASAGRHLQPLVVFLACTGARISEALTLDWEDVDLRARRVLLRDTKNGKDRLVEELVPAAVAALGSLTYPEKEKLAPGRYRTTYVAHRTGRVFRTNHGAPYNPEEAETGGQVKTAWAGACRRAGFEGEWHVGEAGHRWWTPKDVTPHVLRHTWATWHHAVHRDLIKLRDEGDWSDITLVTRYAKACPPYEVPAILEAWGLPAASGENLTQDARWVAARR